MTSYSMRISDWISDWCTSDLLEEHYGTVLELFADNSLRRQAHAVAVKGERCFQIIDAQRDDFDSRLHILDSTLLLTAAQDRKSVVEGKSAEGREDRGGARRINKKKR